MRNVEEIKTRLLNTNYVIDNEYFNKYLQLIESNLTTKREYYKTQIHHIIPRAFYRLSNSVIDNTKENKVNLSIYNHYLAHKYLYHCVDDKLKTYMYQAMVLIAYKANEKGILVDNSDLIDYETWCSVQNKKFHPNFRSIDTLLQEIDNQEFIEYRKSHGRKQTQLKFGLNEGECSRLTKHFNIKFVIGMESVYKQQLIEERRSNILIRVSKEEFIKYLEYPHSQADTCTHFRLNVSDFNFLCKEYNYTQKCSGYNHCNWETDDSLIKRINKKDIKKFFIDEKHTVKETMEKFNIKHISAFNRLIRHYNINKFKRRTCK